MSRKSSDPMTQCLELYATLEPTEKRACLTAMGVWRDAPAKPKAAKKAGKGKGKPEPPATQA
jgi:hypothetical protein